MTVARASIESADSVLRMAHDKARLGYTGIRRALYDLKREIGQNAFKAILLENGVDPIRRKGMS